MEVSHFDLVNIVFTNMDGSTIGDRSISYMNKIAVSQL